MKRILIVPVLTALLFSGCSKGGNDFIWEKSLGLGTAYFVSPCADSGFISCGELSGKPYLIRFDKNRVKLADYKATETGLFSSAWSFNDRIIAAGNIGGKMVVAGFDKECKLLWDTTFTKTYLIDIATISNLGNGKLLVAGSARPDSVINRASGLLFVWIDTAGTVTDIGDIKESSFIAAGKTITDNTGNIFLALTKRSAAGKAKAGVAKYSNSSLLQKLWETELYNNPQFGASSLGLTFDGTGNIFVTGRTEISATEGVEINSFLALLSPTGSVTMKKYLEISNSGNSVNLNKDGQALVLNKNCFIINVLDPVDGTAIGIIRPFDACDSKSTDAFGYDLSFNYDGSLFISGAIGGEFYLAMKSYVIQPPLK